MSFAAALEDAGEHRHALLGNGFSIACRNDIFTYGSLLERADFRDVPYAPQLFEALGTTDFEVVIQTLVQASRAAAVYPGTDPALIHRLAHDADRLKTILVNAIARNHPDLPNEIDDEEYRCCRAFLSNFKHIYTLNYDLLLYWALMHNEEGEWIECDDGFRNPIDEFGTDYVSWEEHHSSNIHYLHGALHLFDAGHQLRKYTWSRTNVPLMTQIRQALDSDMYPLFVAEGTSKAKLNKINHSAYLHKALRSFEGTCRTRNAAFFIFGHSLAENDEHILRLIERGSFPKLYVSLFGDPALPGNQAIMRRARKMADRRHEKRPLSVNFFDAASACVWRA